MARRSIRTTAVLTALLLAVTGCAAGNAPAGSAEPPDGGTDVLAVAASAAVTTWDPVSSFSTEALYMGNLDETLLFRNPVGSDEDYTHVFAESYEASEDGLTWTFTLREGVTFHDGEPLTAEAVVLSVEAAKERGGASFIWAPVERVEATDEHTVVFTLAYAAPLDLIVASTYGAWIVSPAALIEALRNTGLSVRATNALVSIPQSRFEVAIAPTSQQRVQVPIDVVGTGTLLIVAQLTTPDGVPLGQIQDVSVTAQHAIEVALAWTLGIAVVLQLGLGIFRSVQKRRRGQARGDIDELARDQPAKSMEETA